MVYTGLFPIDGDRAAMPSKEALEKLSLNDPALCLGGGE